MLLNKQIAAILLIFAAAIVVIGQTATRPLRVDDLFRFKNVGDPQVSPDGNWAAYRISEASLQPIYRQPVDGGPAKKICTDCGTPTDWSGDGKWLLYTTGGTWARIGLFEVETGKYRHLSAHPR